MVVVLFPTRLSMGSGSESDVKSLAGFVTCDSQYSRDDCILRRNGPAACQSAN